MLPAQGRQAAAARELVGIRPGCSPVGPVGVDLDPDLRGEGDS